MARKRIELDSDLMGSQGIAESNDAIADVVADSVESEVASSVISMPIVVETKTESLAKSAVELIAMFRSDQVLGAKYEIVGGEIIVAKIDNAEICRAKLVDKAGDHFAILENNKHVLENSLAAFAAFGASDVFYEKQLSQAETVIVAKDGRKYRVNLQSQTVSA